MFSISKPFDLTGVFSGPSVPLPYKYRLFSSHPHPDSTTPRVPPSLVSTPFPYSSLCLFTPPLPPYTILLSTTCQLSSATQRASGSSTSTGTCSPSVASGTQKEGVLIYGSAFVLVRSKFLLTATPPLIRYHTDQSTPGSQVSNHHAMDNCTTCFY